MSVGIFKVKTKLDRPFGLFFDRTIKVFLLEEGFFVFLGELSHNYKASSARRQSVSCVIISPVARAPSAV